MDLGIQMDVDIQSYSSTASSLTDGLGAPRTNRNVFLFWAQQRVHDGDQSIKTVLTAKICADVGTKPVSASAPQQRCTLQDWYSVDDVSPLHDKMIRDML